MARRTDSIFPGPRPGMVAEDQLDDAGPRLKRLPPPPPRRQPPSPPRRRRFSLTGFLGRLIALAIIWGIIAATGALLWFSYDLPDISHAVQTERRPTVTLLAADGSEFARFGDYHSDELAYADLPANLVNAVVAIEDRRFRYHFGVDPIGLARALYVNYKSGHRTQGGSTITQQLAKNLFLTPEKSIRRKVQEAILALWLERRFSKDQILAAYLNRVYLGAGTYGVDAASRTYFGKPVKDVTLREAAILAGLLKAPSRYSPTANPDEAEVRGRVVLAAMADAGYISEAERKTAAEPQPASARHGVDAGRYYADWANDMVDDFIGPNHGDVLVRTTYDPALQKSAETRIAEMLAGPGVPARASQAALIAMTPDGAVRALVGGRDYGASEFNRATQALRQPGSSFKPFIYLTALQSGITPDTQIEDTPVRIGNYAPNNYDNKYRGTITVAQALAYSSNVATLRILDRVGIDPVRRLASAMGISSPLTRDLSLALGTSEVTLLDLTRGYAGIANKGVAVWPYAITEIRDRSGAVLYQRKPGGGVQVADPQQVAALAHMMEGVVAFGSGKAARLDRPVSAKSGTTQNYKDAWFMGFTNDLVTGVWVGNDDNTPMNKVTGGGLPAKLWHAFMVDVYAPAGRGRRMDDGIGSLIDDLKEQDLPPPVADAPKPSEGGIGGLIRQLLWDDPRT